MRILFNDSQANAKPEITHHQGGVTSFAKPFTNFFAKNYKDIKLISLLISPKQDTEEIYVRYTRNQRDVFDLIYPKKLVANIYKQHLKKKEFIEKWLPLMEQIELVFDKSLPDLVFLNGFNESNWMMMEIAHRRNIPVVIQHAGIWKKEISVTQKSFSPSVKKILYNMEKDTLKKTTHQIFLNESSRKAFFISHNVPAKYIKKTSIIGLPVEDIKTAPITFTPKEKYQIGMVARWDGIKNHDAIYRLARYFQRHNLPHTINVVTKYPDDGKTTDFREKYKRAVTIVPPMDREKLKTFYKSQDVIIIPSRFETGPFILIESLICGKTVLLSQNTGWTDDYRNADLSDMIFNPRDSGEKIFSLLHKLETNPDKYVKRFARLQKKICEEHTPQKVFGEYYQIFTKLTNVK